eukprot:NODE_2689_length_893_cov_477.059666.p2 GENE.NODE_2689_length_893_cov_477.059666~~NODE_2689_length_893_cov_477.059666.p2  ORF type:complete len:236 (-),score=75.95 NODE_2689_length_893_cov_477.059666:72-779(-)
MPAVLTYWDGQGNAEIMRLMMAVCGEEWEDKVVMAGDGASHLTTKEHADTLIAAGRLAFDQFPLLSIDGLNIVQKMAGVRYLARKYGLCGRDNAEATQIDIISEGLNDFSANDGQTEKKNQDKYLPRIERALRAGGESLFLVGGTMSFVDVQLFKIIDDGTAALGGVAWLAEYPLVARHYAKMKEHPRLAAYLASDKRFPRPGRDGYFDRVKAAIPHVFVGELYPMSAETWTFRN